MTTVKPVGLAAKLRKTFIGFDTNTVRVMIAVSSYLYACLLWATPDLFERPYWRPMTVFSENTWAWLFLSHALLVLWRQVDEIPRPITAFAVNAWGLLLWFVCTGMLTQNAGWSPANAPEFTLIGAGVIALIRTGLNDDKVSP